MKPYYIIQYTRDGEVHELPLLYRCQHEARDEAMRVIHGPFSIKQVADPHIPRYDHQVCLTFTVKSDNADGSDLTPNRLRMALKLRMARLGTDESEWQQAVLPPLETLDTHAGFMEDA